MPAAAVVIRFHLFDASVVQTSNASLAYPPSACQLYYTLSVFFFITHVQEIADAVLSEKFNDRKI